MKLDVKFAENECSFGVGFGEVNNISDGGYERGYSAGYEDGLDSCVTTISGIDLHDRSTDTQNAYLQGSMLKQYNGWITTDHIPVENGKYYLAYSTSAIDPKYCSKFRGNKVTQMTGVINTTDKNIPVLLAGFDGSVRFSGQTTQIETLEFYEVVNFRWEVVEA